MVVDVCFLVSQGLNSEEKDKQNSLPDGLFWVGIGLGSFSFAHYMFEMLSNSRAPHLLKICLNFLKNRCLYIK